jgi:hypothetical protein
MTTGPTAKTKRPEFVDLEGNSHIGVAGEWKEY